MLIKVLRIAVAAVTAVTVLLFAAVFIREKVMTDKTVPVIKIEDGVLEVSVKATEEDLLKGVTAHDGKDGDITDRVLVESISKFSKAGYCKVTYAVSDSDSHVVTARRQIHYTDYKPPEFTMSRSLVFSVYDKVTLTGIIGATDCIEGNVSSNVIIYSDDYTDGEIGEYSIKATVQNSRGDTSEIVLPVTVEKAPRNSPAIELKDYLIYVKKGAKKPDWKKCIESGTDSTGIDAELTYEIETDFTSKEPGVYTVNYYGTDEYGVTGHNALIAVVR